MQFHFSIRNSIQKAWQLFTSHAGLYIVIALLMAVLSMTSNSHETPNILFSIASFIISTALSYIAISVTLAVVDAKEDKVRSVKSLMMHMPTFKQFLKLLGTSILSTVPVFAVIGLSLLIMFLSLFSGLSWIILVIGAIVLAVPTIYLTTRLMFSNVAFIDRQGSIRASLRHSWHITKGSKIWTVLLTVVVIAVLLILVAVCTFGIGLIVAYPLALLVMTQLYRALEKDSAVEPVIVSVPEAVQEVPAGISEGTI